MAQQYLATPKPPPNLNIPVSDATVKVSCVDSTTRLRLPMGPFLRPDYKGNEDLTGPAFGFLIEHASAKIMFDLGTRKEWQTLPSMIVNMMKEGGWKVEVDKDTSEILTDNGVDVAGGAIKEVIWSHHHWDHIGDMGNFPKSTALVVGPGFQNAHLPGFPVNPDAPIPDADFRNRTVKEILPDKTLKLGRFSALDYFGDGSFYLLDTPGHSVGHICGLARTTGGPDSTFVFMGGDACHHGGEFRPTPYLPLPGELKPYPSSAKIGKACPGSLLQAIHRNKNATEPYYKVSPKFAHDLDLCEWTIDGVSEFDAHDNVFVLIAHDDSIGDDIDFFPKTMNDWHAKGQAKKVKWKFLDDFGAGVDAS
ncbi:hypothetical protein K461DRAFT_235780 [Myriangium duriaei CBS 260.36]|uniref:Metallo-beta-lactamase domain-containing protein n=1 Tax=Myriangium duriaei CBS 260.36 TaxID=1168546 RepID=A0A9P4MLM0_9PEZI|nr:hypothetical protein K461DRAFT_235780 [Myriangium duriaei CBS 260.36]